MGGDAVHGDQGARRLERRDEIGPRGQLVRVPKRLESWAERVLIAARLRPDD